MPERVVTEHEQAGDNRSGRGPTATARPCAGERMLLAYQQTADNRAVQGLLSNCAPILVQQLLSTGQENAITQHIANLTVEATPERALSRVSNDSGDSAQRAPTAPTDPSPRTIRFSISVETEGVGHTWLEVARPDGNRDSWGFWPAGSSRPASSSGSGTGIYGSSAVESALIAGGSVAGRVLHPDTLHRAELQHTTLVNEEELARGVAYANAHATDLYNLYSYNCTTFARAMYKAVTGRSAPISGILVDDPSDLAQSIRHEHDSELEFPPTLR